MRMKSKDRAFVVQQGGFPYDPSNPTDPFLHDILVGVLFEKFGGELKSTEVHMFSKDNGLFRGSCEALPDRTTYVEGVLDLIEPLYKELLAEAVATINKAAADASEKAGVRVNMSEPLDREALGDALYESLQQVSKDQAVRLETFRVEAIKKAVETVSVQIWNVSVLATNHLPPFESQLRGFIKPGDAAQFNMEKDKWEIKPFVQTKAAFVLK